MKILESKAQPIMKAFKDGGISVISYGSEDFIIHIKDISSDQIDLTGWESAKEIITDEELVASSQGIDELIVAGDYDDPVMKAKELQHLQKLSEASNIRKQEDSA